jgi:hypothetical protein
MSAREPRSPLRLAVLLSGSGTSLQNLIDRIDAGQLRAEIEVVIASKPDAFGLERARRRGLPAVAVPRKLHRDVGAFNDALHGELARFEIDLVVLLGFLSPFEMRGRFEGARSTCTPRWCRLLRPRLLWPPCTRIGVGERREADGSHRPLRRRRVRPRPHHPAAGRAGARWRHARDARRAGAGGGAAPGAGGDPALRGGTPAHRGPPGPEVRQQRSIPARSC